MKARDVMVSPVITVSPRASIKEVAKTFLERHISAVPVVDDDGKLVGIISEGDLLHRAEAGTERRRPWWLRAFIGLDGLAAEYTKAHARKVADAMIRKSSRRRQRHRSMRSPRCWKSTPSRGFQSWKTANWLD